LRAAIRAARRERTPADREAAGAALARHARAVPGGPLTAFVGVGTEPPTLPLLETLTAEGRAVLLPVLLDDLDLDWAAYDGSDLVRGRRGMLEPAGARLGLDAIATADVVVAPALAVDLAGNRLGQGGGSYDRAIARTTAPVIAVVFDGEILDEVPAEPHDRPVDGVLTPMGGFRWLREDPQGLGRSLP
jgi:5-formyltetrahydrofolate cyclo-ligase